MSNFGAKLRQIRVQAGFSGEELARAIGVSGVYVSRLELGKTPPPTPERLRQIEKVLGPPAGELFMEALLEKGSFPTPENKLGRKIASLFFLPLSEGEFRAALLEVLASNDC
jgi:transcriptional regulator with XRE-family HTH domain